MNNDKIDLYKDLLLDCYYWGGALNIITKVDMNSKADLIKTLDQVCKNENLTALGEDWNEISYNQFNYLLTSAFQFSIGFPKHEVMPFEKAQEYFNVMTKNFNVDDCRCFTNCYDHPWNNDIGTHSFNSISDHTIDLALSIINKDKILLVYFLFDD